MTSAKTAADVLKEARDLLAKDGGWTQGVFARTKAGHQIGEFSGMATCFCILGAVNRAAGEASLYSVVSDAKNALRRCTGRPDGEDSLAAWNDAPSRTQAEVVALFDAARAALAKAGA